MPDADVAVAVEDDLDRLVAASAAPDGARVRETFWDALRDGDEDRETRRCDEDRETRRCDEDAVASYASGAFLDYTGRTRAFARRELASCDAWPQLTATLANFVEARPAAGCSPSCSTPRTTPSTGTDW